MRVNKEYEAALRARIVKIVQEIEEVMKYEVKGVLVMEPERPIVWPVGAAIPIKA